MRGFGEGFATLISLMLHRITFYVLLAGMISVHAESHPLRINELLASNRGGALDDTGASSDWLELHNTGDEVLRLAKFQLSSGGDKPSAWALPNIAIEPFISFMSALSSSWYCFIQ